MANRIEHKFRNPNYSSSSVGSTEEKWIPFWTYNSNNNGKIIFNNNVQIGVNNLEDNISDLMTQIENRTPEANTRTAGYIPKTTPNCFLYANNPNGILQWVDPKYKQYTYTANVTTKSMGNLTEDDTINIVEQGQSVTDFILNLTPVLCGNVEVQLESTFSTESLMIS